MLRRCLRRSTHFSSFLLVRLVHPSLHHSLLNLSRRLRAQPLVADLANFEIHFRTSCLHPSTSCTSRRLSSQFCCSYPRIGFQSLPLAFFISPSNENLSSPSFVSALRFLTHSLAKSLSAFQFPRFDHLRLSAMQPPCHLVFLGFPVTHSQ